MIGFKLGDYALPVIFLGAAFLFFTSNKKLNNLGRILFGVGGIPAETRPTTITVTPELD